MTLLLLNGRRAWTVSSVWKHGFGTVFGTAIESDSSSTTQRKEPADDRSPAGSVTRVRWWAWSSGVSSGSPQGVKVTVTEFDRLAVEPHGPPGSRYQYWKDQLEPMAM